MNRATATMNKSRTDAMFLHPSRLAHQKAEDFFPGIANSALRMLAQQILKRAKMHQPLNNRASCVAVILGIRGDAVRKGYSRGAR